jgi:hypothetical protein
VNEIARSSSPASSGMVCAAGLDANDVERFEGGFGGSSCRHVLHKHLGISGGDKRRESWHVKRVIANHPGSIDNHRCLGAVDIDEEKSARTIGDLRVLCEQQGVQSLVERLGEARGHIEQYVARQIEHPQVRDHPALRRQVGGVTHAANRQRQNVIGKKTLQPCQTIVAGHGQHAPVGPTHDCSVFGQRAVAFW